MTAKKKLTHIDRKGAARMVDVGAKAVTERRAVARGLLRVSASTIALVRDGATPKGDVLAAARLAGIMAAKRTSDLIPLTHPLPLTHASVELVLGKEAIEIEATVATSARTGVEMEALTAGSGAGLSPNDVTTEATRRVIDREIPGIAEALRAKSLEKTAHGMLSRGVAGAVGSALVVNLPGSPRAVRESLEVLLPVVPHAVELLAGASGEQGHASGRR